MLGGVAGASSRSSAPAVVDAPQLAQALAETAGRPHLVHVWATWCVPCVAEWPALSAALRPFAERGVDVLLIAIDDPAAAAAAGRILGGAPLPSRSVLAPLATAYTPLRRLDVQWDGELPLTLVWNSSGNLVLAQRGVTDLPRLVQALQRLAPSGASARAHGSSPRRGEP